MSSPSASAPVLTPAGGGFAVRGAFFLIGFTAAVAQIVLLRELMVVFGGDEVSTGATLGGWLLWTAAGSAAAGRVLRRVRRPRAPMAALETLLAGALPATVLAVRAAKGILQTVPGESLGPAAALLVSLGSLGPLCFISGALFAAGSRVRALESGAADGEATGAVYLMEAAGAAAGGLLAGLALVRLLGSMQMAVLLGLLNLAAACGLGLRAKWAQLGAAGALAGLSALVFLPSGVPKWEKESLQRLWPGYRLAAARNSAYGNLAVLEAESIRSLYENGQLLFSAPDPEAAEEAVHYALLEHPAPRSLLLIGGGLNGSIGQALQHRSLERVDYVELDPAILELARNYFPEGWGPAAKDPRVRIHVTDARRFLNTGAGSFDVVIVNLPEPRTAQLNRFYTAEFFREAAAKMTPDGVLSFGLPASENYIGPETAEFLGSVGATLRTVFPEVVAMPGATVHFFAAKRAGVLVRDAEGLLARLRERRLETSYVREYYLPFRMSAARMEALEEQIRPQPGARVNRDFAPVAYYFDIAVWSSRFSQEYARFFRAVAGIGFARVAGFAGLLALGLAACGWLPGSERRRRTVATSCTAAMGFTSLGLEVLLLLGFQAIYGSMYRQLALLIGAFMAGMALGSWVATRRPQHAGKMGTGANFANAAKFTPVPIPRMRALTWSQSLAAVAPLALCALFALQAAMGGHNAAGQFLFLFAAAVCGALGGFEFPVASGIFFSGGKARGLGTLYAVDLAGSCLGATLFSVWLIPVFGFFRTAALAAIVNLGPAALAWREAAISARRKPAQ